MPNFHKPLSIYLIEHITKHLQVEGFDNPHYNISLNTFAFEQLQKEILDYGVEPLVNTLYELVVRCENITFKFYIKKFTNA